MSDWNILLIFPVILHNSALTIDHYKAVTTKQTYLVCRIIYYLPEIFAVKSITVSF